MDTFKHEKLVSLLIEKIESLERIADYYESENAKLRKQIEDGVHVSVTIKEEK